MAFRLSALFPAAAGSDSCFFSDSGGREDLSEFKKPDAANAIQIITETETETTEKKQTETKMTSETESETEMTSETESESEAESETEQETAADTAGTKAETAVQAQSSAQTDAAAAQTETAAAATEKPTEPQPPAEKADRDAAGHRDRVHTGI